MQPINTNTTSAIVQDNLTASQGQLNSAIQQLSTGLRISNAADDAAGFAILQRMSAQINGLNQASVNVNDGISLLQVADGAVAQITDNFQKMRTLAVEASNPTYSISDRQALQNQVDQLMASTTQISQQTNFNGTNLLDGTFTNEQLQIGANPTQTLQLTIPPAFVQLSAGTTVQAPLQQATASGQVVAAIGPGDLKIDGTAIGASVAGAQAGQGSGSAWAVANAITNANIHGLTATASSTLGAIISSHGTLSINGVALGAIGGANNNAVAANAVAAINGASGSTGVSATASGTTLSLSTSDGRSISITGTALSQSASTNGTVTLTTAVSPYSSAIIVAGNNPENAGLTPGSVKSVDSGGTVPIAIPVPGQVADVTSTTAAEQTITYLDTQIANCNNIAAYLGANQNALASIHANLSASSINLSTAQARIQDTDYAAATATLAHSQILQNVGSAMLAQANAAPRSILQLLSG